MSEHIPEIEEYVKRLNWYLQEHYPANKKITAEEWNALFLALMNQGNAQEDTLAQICNELLPIQVTAINDLIDITADHESRVTSLEDTAANHGQRITDLETLTQTHEQRLDVLEPIITDHGNRIEDLESLTASHSVLITGLRTDINSNTNRIKNLETETANKPYRVETVLKYNISTIPQGVIYAKNGKKDLLIEFFNETFTVPLSETTTGSRKGSVIVVDKVTDNTTHRTTQTEVFYFKEGVVTRQIIYDENTGSTITMSDWSVANNGFFQSLRASITENADEILGIKRDYATKSELDTAKTNLQTQITTNRTDLNTILPDYVKKSDNTNIDYLTRNELSVSDTGALVQTESLKNITTGTTSAPRQTTPIPVVDNKARLFLPQEIASLRDLVDWKASLLGEAINFIVSYADIPDAPTPEQLQTYLNNKWASIGGTTPIIDQTTMTDESIPLSYRWYVNENKWVYARGITSTRATNNIYDEHGTLVTPGARGTSVGSNLKYHVMYETNGEGAVVGLDALEETVTNNSADISELRGDLTDYETSNNTEVTNLKTRATNLETRATTLEGLVPTKMDKGATNTTTETTTINCSLANALTLKRNAASGGAFIDYAPANAIKNWRVGASITGLTGIYGTSTGTDNYFIINNDLTVGKKLASSSLRTYTFPEKSGTVALTSDVPDITGKANDSDVIHLTGNEAIDGTKTFKQSIYLDASTPFIIGKNGKGGFRAVNSSNTQVGQMNISDGWYTTGRYGVQISALDTTTNKHNQLRVSYNGPQYVQYDNATGTETIKNVALVDNIPTSINGLAGGELTSPLIIDGGDALTAHKIRLGASGNITGSGATETATLLGRSGATGFDLLVGHASFNLKLRGSGTRPTFNENELALKSELPTVPTNVSAFTNDAGYTTNTGTITGVQLNGTTIASSGTANVQALPNFSLNILHQSAGNPRPVKFLSVNYNTAAAYFKMGATSCHDNGTSYQFLEDIIIGCTTSGSVVCNVYKYCQQEVSYDGATRNYGDVFYVVDTTNKIVDFYILCGQWASSQFTPATKIGNTTIAYITQYTGAAAYYSSGTKVWANNGVITTTTALSKFTFQTTEPTADITDGGIHIVYLASEPTTKYNGYIYLIAEA